MLKILPYFGILKAPHARFDCVIVLKCAGFLEEYTVITPELSGVIVDWHIVSLYLLEGLFNI